MLVILLGTGIGFAGSTDQIPEGVMIAGVDVGGMTAGEARRALEKRAAQVSDQPVTFTAGGKTFTVEPKKLGLTTNWDAAIQKALSEGNGFILFRGFERIALRISGSAIAPPATASGRALDREIHHIAVAVDRPPREAAVTLQELQPVVVPARAESSSIGTPLERCCSRPSADSSTGTSLRCRFERPSPR